MRRVSELLSAVGTEQGRLPPTTLYNEGWMLALVLDWFSRRAPSAHPLAFEAGARWYCEGLLRSPFLARHRGDELAEQWTHADGVIGHTHLMPGRGDLRLDPDATQLVVVEAKMCSPLSGGVRRASFYDQAARTVACMAEVCATSAAPFSLSRVGFVVLAPEAQIKRKVFGTLVTRESVAEKVRERVAQYGQPPYGDPAGESFAAKQRWLEASFEPFLSRTDVSLLSWESVIETVAADEPEVGVELSDFYRRCLTFNCRAPAVPQAIV
jgi:hypothetical protein